MHVVFDVDGCLIDSRELIRLSYREAGVDAPRNILECESVDWLGARGYARPVVAALKAEKNLRYLHHLRHDMALVATLPAYDVACRLADEGHRCQAYTAAPHGTIAALSGRLPRWPFGVAQDGIRTPERMRLLGTWPRGGVYLDDQSRLIRLPDNWRFVHVADQDADRLYSQITE